MTNAENAQKAEQLQKLANQRLINESYAHVMRNGMASTFMNQKLSTPTEQCQFAGIGCAFAPAIRPEMRETADEDYGCAASILQEEDREKMEAILEPWALYIDSTLAAEVQGCHDDHYLEDEPEFFVGKYAADLKTTCENFDLVFPGDK